MKVVRLAIMGPEEGDIEILKENVTVSQAKDLLGRDQVLRVVTVRWDDTVAADWVDKRHPLEE
jgi:hypothetical protein